MLVIDKRPNIVRNVYTEDVEGVQVHSMAHTFSTPTTPWFGITSRIVRLK